MDAYCNVYSWLCPIKTTHLKNAMWFCDDCIQAMNADDATNETFEMVARFKSLEAKIEALTNSLQGVQTGQLSYDENWI